MAELYFGFAVNSGTAVPGTTPGFTYQGDSAGDGVAWNADVTQAVAPAWDDSGQTAGLMVLLYETSSTPVFSSPALSVARGIVNRVASISVRIG
jgi:hypothetical protein